MCFNTYVRVINPLEFRTEGCHVTALRRYVWFCMVQLDIVACLPGGETEIKVMEAGP